MVQCGLAVIMTVWSDLVNQLTYLSLTLSLTSALTIAAVFRLDKQDRPHPFLPLLYIIGTLLCAVASLKTLPKAGLAALATLGSGATVYVLFFSRKARTREHLPPGEPLS